MFLFILFPLVFTAQRDLFDVSAKDGVAVGVSRYLYCVTETSFPALDTKASGSYAGLL